MYDPIEHEFNSWSDREEREDALERFSYQFGSEAEDLLLDEGWSSDDEGFESEVHSLALELAEQEIEEAKREWEATLKEIYESRYDNYYN